MTKETYFEHPPKGHVAILAYDSANDRWQAIYVDSSGNLQVDIAAAEQLECLAHQYTGSEWVKSNLLFGYHDRYAESESETSTGAGQTTVDLTPVSEGEVWVIQHIGMHHNDTVARSCFLETVCGAVVVPLNADSSLDPLVRMFWQGQMVMKEDDYIRARVNALADTKPMYCYAQGYKMDIAM